MPKIEKQTYAEHKAEWRDCEKCHLSECRKNVALFRGKIPCDVLFVGEFPGNSEDVLGKASIGPAGKYLDELISRSSIRDFRIGHTSLVACISKDGFGNIVEPGKISIMACSQRLQQIVKICEPELIVCVGRLTSKWLDRVIPRRKQPSIEIIHPGAIFQMDISQQGLAEQRIVVALDDAAEKLVPF